MIQRCHLLRLERAAGALALQGRRVDQACLFSAPSLLLARLSLGFIDFSALLHRLQLGCILVPLRTNVLHSDHNVAVIELLVRQGLLPSRPLLNSLQHHPIRLVILIEQFHGIRILHF